MNSGYYNLGVMSQKIQLPQFEKQSNFILPPLLNPNISQLNNTSSTVGDVFSNQLIRAVEDTLPKLEKTLNQNSNILKRLSPSPSG